jgi:hypothetical protein
VLPGPVDRGGPVSRIARTDRIGDHQHTVPAREQAEHRLQDADVRLAPGHDDLAHPGGHQRVKTRIRGRRECGLGQDRLRVVRQRRHRRPQAGRVLLGRADRHVQQPGRLGQAYGPGHHDLAVVDGGHEPLLQVDQEHDGTFSGEQHAIDATA